MKRVMIAFLCFMMICMQLLPCFALTNDRQIEENQDGSFFVISSEPLASAPPIDPDSNETAPGISANPEDGAINSLISLFKKIINALMQLIGRLSNQTQVTKTKYIYYYSSDSKLIWSGELTGQFMYSDSSARCMDASFSFMSYDGNWKLDDYTCSANAATASVVFSVVHKSLGVKLQTITKTITLTCDTDGNVT